MGFGRSEVVIFYPDNIDNDIPQLRDNVRKDQNKRESWIQWVDLRENLQETIDFPMKYGIFL